MKFDNDIIVFTNAPQSYAPKRILEESSKKSLNTLLVNYADMGFSINSIKFPKSRSVFIRGMGENTIYSPLRYALIKYYKNTAKLLNSKSFKKWICLDKITQHIELKKAGLSVATSYFFGSIAEAKSKLTTLNFPIIVKFNVGTRGESVYKLGSIRELNKVVANYDIKTLLFQEFLPGGEDLRVIVLGEKILGAMKRIAKKGSYLTNYSQGGLVEKYDIEGDLEASKIAIAVSDTFKLDYCGVDLMRGNDGKWKVLEVNRACQFEGFEKATGINVAKQVVEYLVN